MSHLRAVGFVAFAAVVYACAVRTSPDGPTKPVDRTADAAVAPPTSDSAPLSPPATADAAAPLTLPTTAFSSSKVCGGCHASIVADWSTSMHSRALTSPLMIAETNQGIRGPYAEVPNPDPKRICVNCHSPSAARVTTTATLPLGDATTLNDEGVSCETCHQFNGTASAGGGGYSTAYLAGLQPGTTVFGPLEAPATTPQHTSASSDSFNRPNTMCGNCHDVNYDRNADGRIVKGTDLVLQQTWDEYVSDYKAVGGTETCITCHMPVLAGRTKAVDGASTPDRQLHDHSFIGVDYALEDVAQRDGTHDKRSNLLKSAAKLTVATTGAQADPTKVTFQVTITNSGSGHNLPTGFAFVRQMWLEVTALNATGAVVASSGVLAKPSDDLCENELLSDTANPLATVAVGCTAVDPSLVTFQQKLVDSVELAPDGAGNIVTDQLGQPVVRAAAASREVLLQLIPGGVVARKRPFDGIALTALRPFETRTVNYTIPVQNGGPATSVNVRLLFRNAAPYFVRGLGAGSQQDVPNLTNLASNLEVIEMATATTNL